MEEIKELIYSFVEALATVIDERTPYNGTHTRKVAEYSELLANQINKEYEKGRCEEQFDAERMEKLRYAALLHDIGKMVVPLSVMNRSTRLDKDLERIECRFELLQAYYENDMLKGNISKEAYREKTEELAEILDFVREINGIGFLDDENHQRVQEITRKRYQSADGKEIPYFTEEEKKCLSIRKGTLTEEARKLMEGHVTMTAKILGKVHFTKNYEKIPKWAAGHHEFLDGSGYPNHLTAEELDLETRILTVADIYDALTATDRPYKKPVSRKEAFHILRNMAEEGKIEMRLVHWLEEAVEEEEKNEKEPV